MASADILRAAHTALPWTDVRSSVDGRITNITGPNGRQVVLSSFAASCGITSKETSANTEFVFRACNAHYQMLEALNVVRRSAAWTGLAEETKDLVCAAIAAAEAEAGR